MDQYLEKDARDRKAQPSHELSALHHKLYGGSAAHHAGSVYYALVCRVLLGDAATTRDAKTELVDGSDLFEEGKERRVLKSGAHALVGETGGVVVRFREFVSFREEVWSPPRPAPPFYREAV